MAADPITGRRRPPPLLVGAGIIALAIALTLAAGLALGRWPLAPDRAIMLGLRAWHGPVWLPRVAGEITTLGSGFVLTLVVLALAALLTITRHQLAALATLLAAATGSGAVTLLKQLVGRPRPEVVEHWAVVHDLSFPSGHSASSAVIYLTLAALATQVIRGAATRRAVLAVAILLVGAIGLSRVYLGVHWPSDVLAGWSFGTLWAIGWWHLTAGWRRTLRQPE